MTPRFLPSLARDVTESKDSKREHSVPVAMRTAGNRSSFVVRMTLTSLSVVLAVTSIHRNLKQEPAVTPVSKPEADMPSRGGW